MQPLSMKGQMNLNVNVIAAPISKQMPKFGKLRQEAM
jgi:hypothetical protein